jgi:hypothetical protein
VALNAMSLFEPWCKAMGNREDRYALEGMLEFDEGYFTVESSEAEQAEGKRSRGAVGKQNVAVATESTVLEDIEAGAKSNQCRCFKAKVLDNHEKEGVNELTKNAVDEKSIFFSCKSTSYVDISEFVDLHFTEKLTKETTKETLKWVHVFISNAKRTLIGNHHKVKRKYLQLYLNEFVYKLNRRYFGDKLFERVVTAGVIGLWSFADTQINN